MGRGRAPCCDKNQVKRGPWSPAEDLRLVSFIQKHGHENWRALPKQAGLLRCGKSCRLRWINYLRPDVKRGNFTIQEEDTIIKLHQSFGNKWSKIASHLPGRTDNEIKNVWNTHLRKRLALKKDTDINSNGDETKEFSISISSSSSSSSTSNSIMSRSKGNIDMAKNEMIVQEKLKDPSNGTSLIENPKEITSSSPNSSDASRQEEQMASVFNYRDVHDTLQEVNKPDSSNKKYLEIPLESDIDFWDMLDNLCPFQSNEVQQAQAQAWQSSNFGEKYCSREVENRKQLRYLESELGLEAENQENLGQDEAETQMVPEMDPAMAYFQMWPFWPQNSAI